MAQSQFTLLNNQTFTNQNIISNGVFDLWTSTVQNNSNGLPAMRLVVDYNNVNPTDIGGINVVVEAQNNGLWFPIAYQFEPYRNSENGSKRIIILQQDMNTYDDGIDSIVYVGNATVARISRQQGRAGSSFRVRISVAETNYGTMNAFQSATISMYGELYD